MRTLVTGANGFIGHHAAHRSAARGPVCAVVRRGARLGALDRTRPGVRVVEWDGRTASLQNIVDDFGPDRMLHLAAAYRRSHAPEDVTALVDANVRVAAQVLEAARHAVVVLATTHFMHYRGPRRALNLYAATKLAMLEVARYYGDAHQRCWAALTLYDVYGPDDGRRKLLDVAMAAAREGRPMRAPEGDPVLRMLHVYDAVDALHAAASAVAAEPESTGIEMAARPAVGLRVREILSVVERVVGRPVPLDPRPYPAPERTIEDPFVDLPMPPDWAPRIDLAQGLATMARRIAS